MANQDLCECRDVTLMTIRARIATMARVASQNRLAKEPGYAAQGQGER
jgi:hypothetical protein